MNAELIIPGDAKATLHYAAQHFTAACRKAIAQHGFFAVALSGGSTPKALYTLLCQSPFSAEIEWGKVHLFWSDERSVPPSHADSNYHMAMKAGLDKMPLPPGHIHRMVAEVDIEKHAHLYEQTLRRILGEQSLDLVMLGMGEDGHTASLFPQTDGLKVTGRLAIPNFVPQKKTWRMTLTLDCINDAAQIVFYALGASKAEMLAHVFASPPHLPCQFVGTQDHPALWIVDEAAASLLKSH